jgi:hypothetical protein
LGDLIALERQGVGPERHVAQVRVLTARGVLLADGLLVGLALPVVDGLQVERARLERRGWWWRAVAGLLAHCAGLEH